jgi:predicted nucleic acid-binding Zn ribbon protein
MNKTPTLDQDRRRKRALMAFQILIYGYLLVMCLIQLHMYSNRDW